MPQVLESCDSLQRGATKDEIRTGNVVIKFGVADLIMLFKMLASERLI
jgi:hypothetical protein